MLPKDGYTIQVETLNDWLLGQFKGTLLVLFAAVALLLLIGCGNVSILMLARGTARLQELATRLAVGASRPRIIRQLLTESVMLAVTGGALGMAMAYAAIHFIVGLLPEYSIPHEVVIHLNVPVLLFSTAVSVLIGILAGLSPALQFSSPHISQMVQSSGTRSTTSYGARTRAALIMGQIALTVLMLAGAGAAMRDFLQAYTSRLGFETHNILMLDLAFPEKRHSLPGRLVSAITMPCSKQSKQRQGFCPPRSPSLELRRMAAGCSPLRSWAAVSIMACRATSH